MEAVTDHASSATPPDGTNPRRRRSVWLIIILVLVGALIALLAIGLQPRTSLLLQGKEAPDFRLTAFNGEFDGQSFSLSALRGKIIVLNMWASWCVECEKEAVVLERAWQDYRARDVWFIGVDYLDTDTAGLEYLRRYGITYPNGADIGSRIYQDYRCTGVPETFFIDRQGVVQHVQVGPIGQPQLYGLIDRLLAAD
jgi:cytochrome c biogenesis protein CcmG/thiol:disulfide interchange protein DsbE